MNEIFLTGLDSIIEEVLILISFMSLETRNIAVYLIPPGSMYSSKRMRVPEDVPEPREGTEIGLCALSRRAENQRWASSSSLSTGSVFQEVRKYLVDRNSSWI
ncbi:hypothetical protein V1504DRAFT_224201 [Lipomyces starkeyi]